MQDYISSDKSFLIEQSLKTYMSKVYAWMTGGLILTALVAFLILSTGVAGAIYSTPGLFWIAIFGELGLVMWISAGINRISKSLASFLFLAYAALNGLTLSIIIGRYSPESVYSTFVVCALMFGFSSLYGAITKRNLASFGSFVSMGVFGLVIAMVANMFFNMPALELAISLIGVFLFTGLAAWDAQKLKMIAYSSIDNPEMAAKLSIVGALTLYLDFINLFLFLLRFLGRRN